MKILVTGGIGFLGSNLVSNFLQKNLDIVILDNLSAEISDTAKQLIENKNIQFHKLDCVNCNEIKNDILQCDHVFHFAANPDIRKGQENPDIDFHNNLLATHNLLKVLSNSSKLKKFVFSSSSVVYGEPTIFPTKESYGPLFPISFYGSSKLANEAMISSFSHKYNFKSFIFRFANVVGPDSTHGIIYDFVKKLKNNSEQLEILGDGNQIKSYLYISDCILGILHGINNTTKSTEIFNLGTRQQTSVTNIAKIILEEMKISNIKFIFKKTFNDGRGWSGDVKKMLLDCTKIYDSGWEPKYSSDEAIKITVQKILQKL